MLMSAKKKGNIRLYHILLTLCGTGIRISELRYITANAVLQGRAEINMKGKHRVVLLPNELKNRLKDYMSLKNISQGCVFITKNGNPVDRSNIFHEMKRLSAAAGVEKQKVYPHNFRHLFARTFYAVEKIFLILRIFWDIPRLRPRGSMLHPVTKTLTRYWTKCS